MSSFSPKKPEKIVISMRIDIDVLAEVDRKALEYEISRNEFINQCIKFSLTNMDNNSDK